MGLVSILPLLAALWGENSPSEEVTFLRKVAQDLMVQGQPSKALVLLQRARSMDSLQLDIDRLMNQCRARLGGWVAPDASSGWNDVDGRLEPAVRANPDSMFKVAGKLIEAENIPGALRILSLLTRSNAANPVYLKAYGELLTRQEMKVAFHRDLAERATQRGEVSEGLVQWRQAFAAKPDDLALQELVEKADRTTQVSLQSFQESLQSCLQVRDDACALDVLVKSRVAHPEEPRFRKIEDSLKTRRNEFYTARILRIDSLADSGKEQDALESMESMNKENPGEPALAKARDALQDRIARRRKRELVDSVSLAFNLALREGDVSRAEGMVLDLRGRGVGGDDADRLRQKVDSVHARARNVIVFNEALSTARRSLSRGDTASARMTLQKTLSVQPDNVVAKGILGSLGAVRAPSPPVPQVAPVKSNPARAPDDGAQKRVNELVLAGISAYRSGEYKNAMDRWKQALVIDPGCVQAERYLANVGRKQARLQ